MTINERSFNGINRDRIDRESEFVESCIAPRVALLSENNLLLVRYNNTSWFGLPGGKVTENESEMGGNFLSFGAFPNLDREVYEETGEKIGGDLERASACLGLSEIGVVRGEKITIVYSPVFVCRVERPLSVRTHTELVNFRGHIPGPLFPETRMTIERLKRGGKGRIVPEFLNPEGKTIFVDFNEEEPRIIMISSVRQLLNNKY